MSALQSKFAVTRPCQRVVSLVEALKRSAFCPAGRRLYPPSADFSTDPTYNDWLHRVQLMFKKNFGILIFRLVSARPGPLAGLLDNPILSRLPDRSLKGELLVKGGSQAV
jgi:hypothetical protein